MNIFDKIKDSFGTGHMQTSPSVMEEGTQVRDPLKDYAEEVLGEHWNPRGSDYNPREIREIPSNDVLGPSVPRQTPDIPPELTRAVAPRVDASTDSVQVPPQSQEEMAREDYENSIFERVEKGMPMQDGLFADPTPRGQILPGTVLHDGTIYQPEGVPPPGEMVVPEVPGPSRSDGYGMGADAYREEYGTELPEDMSMFPDYINPLDQAHAAALEKEKNKPAQQIGGIDETVVDFQEPTDEDEDITPEEAVTIKEELAKAEPVAGGATPDETAKVAADDPKGFKKAMGWFTKTFGINGQDLAQTALFYAGSRLAGYSHSGSMTFAFDNAIKNTRSRGLFAQQLTNTGDYTNKSIAEFQKTGDRTKLVKTAVPNPIKRDMTSPKLDKKGGKWYKTTDKTGNIYYTDTNGNRRDGAGLIEPTDPETRSTMIDEASPRLTTLTNEFVDLKGKANDKHGKPINPNWQIKPTEAGANAVEIILDQHAGFKNSEQVNQATYTSVYSRALENAWRASESGTPVTDITPFVLAELDYYEAKNPWQKNLMIDGEPLPIDTWFDVKDAAMGQIKQIPGYDERIAQGYTPDQMLDFAMTQIHKKFLEDSTPEQQRKGDAFYRYLRANT